jgi:peptide/nickel transport system substrate-binding protein
MSRWSRLSVGVAVVAMLLACAMTATAAEKILVIATEGDVETLDPNFSRYPTANMVNLNVYDQFFQYGRDDTGKGYFVTNVKKIEGAAIQKWEVAPDRMSVMLHVRKGVKFAKSGNEMTADDIVYWFDRGKPTNQGIQWNIEMCSITGWEKKGKYDVLVKFGKPLNLFFMLLRDQCAGILDSVEAKKHATDKDPWSTEWLAKNDAGAGEFYVESWTPGVQMVLAANEKYWAGKAAFDKVILKVIPDSSNRAALLKKGEVDIALGLSPDQMDELRGQPGVNVLSVPSRTEVVVIMNCSIPPFNAKEVRQAVSYLVPYDTILKDIYKGRGLAAKSVIPTLGVYHNPSYWKYETNPAKAKELLAKAGVPQGFEFTLNIKQGEEISSLLAVTLQSAFNAAGVRLKIREVTNAIWAQEMANGTHQATLWATGYLSYIDDPWYKLRGFISGSVTNRPRYNNPRIDKLYEDMQVNFEDKARTAMANELQEMLVNDAPFLWLANIPLDYVLRSDIQGFTMMQDSLLWFYPLKRSGK